jgi:L-lactate utilization protein LutB
MHVPTGSGVSAYLSTLPGSALRYLDKPVDRNTDLIVLAKPMVNWEQKLQTYLGLTDVDVHDIKSSLSNQPELQRSVRT